MADAAQKNYPSQKTISGFKSQLTGGGARSNLFEVQMTFPSKAFGNVEVKGSDTTASTGDKADATTAIASGILGKLTYLCKAANLPASNIAPIEVPFRGRTLKIAGDRTFDSWTITIINDTDFVIRSAFEKWMNSINRVVDNTGLTNPVDYTTNAFVYQLDRNGQTLREYKFYDVFPTQVSPIELSYDAQGIQEFTVELQVQYWEALKGDAEVAGSSFNIN